MRIFALYLGAGALITATTIEVINTQTWQIDCLIGIFIFVLLGVYTYALAQATLRQIQKVTERQRRFAGNVAHELRTPLAAMKTNFEVTLMGADGGREGVFKELTDTLRSGIEEI
jgi:signal transduction histidine kinase